MLHQCEHDTGFAFFSVVVCGTHSRLFRQMMPLPKLLKTIMGHEGKANRNSHHGSDKCFVKPNSPNNFKTTMIPSSSQTCQRSGNIQHAKPKSLSQINGLHSHRNLKISHQLQLAESMFDANVHNSFESRLSLNFRQCLTDDVCLPYFLQFIELYEKSTKAIITCFLQVNCLAGFLRDNFKFFNFDNEPDKFGLAISFDDKQRETFIMFVDDFARLFNHFSLLKCDAEGLVIDDELRNQLRIFFENRKGNPVEMETRILPFKLFYLFWKSLHDKIETKYYEPFLRSNFYLKYEIEILKSDYLQLSDIIHSNTAIASTFLDFMNSEEMKHFVDFLIMHKHYKTYSGQHSDAVALYDRFFNFSNKSSGSFLGFSDIKLQELKTSTRKETFKPECFDVFANILIQYFSKTYLPQFLQSESFFEYIKSCQTKVKFQSNLAAVNQLSCKSNTFEVNKRDSNVSSLSSLTDDGGNRSDCDSRWMNNLKGQLQFTYIDDYGRMNSLFEQDSPTRSIPNGKLTNVIKRLTSNPLEEKKKEDDAWRIAQSIINDVCSVTIDHAETRQQDTVVNHDTTI